MGWNRSDVIALSSLIVAVVAIIVGVADPEVRCFVGLQSESCPPSQITPKPPRKTTLISKTTGVDYSPLRDLLEAGKWKEADAETGRTMFQVAGRENEESLRKEDIDNFPCEDLRIIDQLWLDASQRKFGFSVQKDIYQNLVGTREYEYEDWHRFGTQVGWKQGHNWLNYSDLIFNLTAPKGHLPNSIYRHMQHVVIINKEGHVVFHGVSLFSPTACDL